MNEGTEGPRDQINQYAVEEIAKQISRYFTAIYGADYVFSAPETFPNVLEQWMLAVAAGDLTYSSDLMARIEELAEAARTGSGQ